MERIEEGRDGPLLLRACLPDKHQGAVIEKEDVLGIDGGKALAKPKMDGGGAGVHGFEVHAGEDVEMIVGSDPDAARGILKEREDEGFLYAILRPEAMELGAVIAKETVFGRDPEEACLILDDLEDVEVAQAFVLAVVAEDEVLRPGVDRREETKQ